jgi:3-oxoacyl-[acyl-carrier protein] reductase
MERIADTAVVTGGSGAIGRATVRHLADLGMQVVINSYSREREGAELAGEIGATAIHVQADLTQRSEAQRLINAAVSHFGRIDLVVNLAGATVGGGPFVNLTEDDWAAAFDRNFYTAVWTSQAAIPAMGASGGRIINTSSVRGLEHCGRTSIMAYSAAKAALINFTKTLAKELAPEIMVNAIAPGFVRTPNYDSMSDDLVQGFIGATPLGRFLHVDEIARAIGFLARADGITGEVLTVDGGFSLKLQ